MPKPLTNAEVNDATRRARAVLAKAVKSRENTRRRTKRSNPLRQLELAAAIDSIAGAMQEIRSIAGRLRYAERVTPEAADAFRQASADLQAERRKLRKMQ